MREGPRFGGWRQQPEFRGEVGRDVVRTHFDVGSGIDDSPGDACSQHALVPHDPPKHVGVTGPPGLTEGVEQQAGVPASRYLAIRQR
jgi:hypothetical protein